MTSKYKRLSFGSIDKRASGRYRARYRNPLDKSKWISAPYTFPVREQARQWLAKVEADILNGVWKHPDQISAEKQVAIAKEAANSLTLNEWVDQWLAQMRAAVEAGEKSANTIRSYTNQMTHIRNVLGDKPIRSITVNDITSWYANLAQPNARGKVLSGKTRTNILAGVRSCFNYALEQGVIETSPVRIKGANSKKYQAKKPLRYVPTHAEVQAAVDAAHPVIGTCILIAAYAGLRYGEIAALTRENLILTGDNPRIRVRAGVQRDTDGTLPIGPGKSIAAIREIPIPTSVAKQLRTYVAKHVKPDKDAFVVFNPGTGTGILDNKALNEGRGRWHDARAKAGLPEHFKFHDLRALYLTRLAQSGATLAELKAAAGHETVETVMIYQTAEAQRLKALASSIDPAASTSNNNISQLPIVGNQ